jgi:hypothetical protein
MECEKTDCEKSITYDEEGKFWYCACGASGQFGWKLPTPNPDGEGYLGGYYVSLSVLRHKPGEQK